ncbi:iron-siderophore ABC transporter substrate-binding protein [Nocardioides sp. SYSU D00038]|uniref:iron-siderophore ABC transporter substrate-binding protein n=1 Tax=Nocardioides sp. SYSU D00038 TaxID=2812554 RepID=UPI001967483E|nr:ABC transporter substrate-binding protein [Nocardioides sp. SYSU D00038]
MMRRPLLLLTPVLLAATALAACGNENDGDPAPSAGGSSAEAGSEAGGTFPAVVEHKYGETTVPEEPERVVTVGVTEQDVVLQLGVVPVGVTEWYGEQPSATWPWAQELLGDAEPEVLTTTNGLQFEKIAALQPDLIVGTNAGLTEDDYEKLSAIAPTVTSSEGSEDYFSDWQDQTLQIARALGREDEGQALIDGIEQRYAELREEHPEWQDMTATFSQGGPYDGNLYVYPAGLNTDFLSELGFELTTGLEEYAPEAGSQALISAENVGLIDADVIVFATESKEMFDELQGFGTIADLAAVKEGRAVYTDDVLAGAIYFLTPLSIEYVLDELTPLLEKATAGEAPTEFPTTA